MEQNKINLENLDRRIRMLEIEISVIKNRKKGKCKTALLSEKSLKKEWLNKGEDEAWKDL
jgi:hypothetical protein